jgi:splicing suppressor protein 51
MMPEWWNSERRDECLECATKNEVYNIRLAVEKADIQENYKDRMMPMQLRMMAENIYGGGYGMGQQSMPKGYQCFCST